MEPRRSDHHISRKVGIEFRGLVVDGVGNCSTISQAQEYKVSCEVVCNC